MAAAMPKQPYQKIRHDSARLPGAPTKGKGNAMSNLSRRTLVSSVAALPALAVPAVASFSSDHPDAELLRLGVQLEEIGRLVDAENAEGHRRYNEWQAACERAGLPDIALLDWPGGEAEIEKWREYTLKRMALCIPPPTTKKTMRAIPDGIGSTGG
jgi:hypothetical protein